MLAGLLLVMLGLVSLWGARSWMRLRRQVNAWPVVRGHVTARHAIQPTDRGRTARRPSAGPRTCASPIASTTLTTSVRRSGCPGDGRIPRPRPRPAWPPSLTRSDVRYDPTDPQTSCLYPAPYGNVLWYGIPGLVLLGVGGLILLVQALGGTP